MARGWSSRCAARSGRGPASCRSCAAPHGVIELPVGVIDASQTAAGDLIRLDPA